MAQLIKIQDYVSRYEWNIYRYPSQYIRLKQENWQRLKHLWGNQSLVPTSEDPPTKSKWKSLFQREKQTDEGSKSTYQDLELPRTERELRKHFLNRLFPMQLKWATSTVVDVSFMDKQYESDKTLTYFLQRFPDTYLIMYYPIFDIKKTSIEGEIIMISPLGIEVIYLLEETEDSFIRLVDDRSCEIYQGNKKKKIVNPILALKRTEKIIKAILHKHGIKFSVKKVVLSRVNTITYNSEPYNTSIIDKNNYEKWFSEKRSLVSPLKNIQLKASEYLLANCQTSSVKRPEWEEDDQTFTFVDEV